MQVTLTITGSASAIAAVLAAIPDHGNESTYHMSGAATPAQIVSTMREAERTGAVPSTSTGTGIPDGPAFPPFAPSVGAAIPPAPSQTMTPPETGEQDDEDGADSSGALVDSRGFPWDERIHSSNRKFKADGTWTLRKGVDKASIPAIEAELRGQPAAPPPPPVAAPATLPPLQVSPVQPAPAGMPTAQPFPQTAVPPMPVAVPTQAGPAAGSIDFMGLMTHVAQKSSTGQMDSNYLADVARRVGEQSGQTINAITDTVGKQDLIDQVVALIVADNRW